MSSLQDENGGGMRYLRKPLAFRHYRHMRSMLQQIWDIQSKSSFARFEIDVKFARDQEAITKYILENASVSEINLAHERAIEELASRGRGRPKGALNKSRFVKSEPKTSSTLAALDDYMPDDAKEPEDMTADELASELRTPTSTSSVDLSKYALKTELQDIATNVTKACAGAFNTLKAEVKSLRTQLDTALRNKPTVIELVRPNLPKLELGFAHVNFPDLLIMANSITGDGYHNNIWVYGPAGTGKSTAAKMVAKAMNLPFYTNGKLASDFQVLGYNNAQGVYITTEFRKAYEGGGVYCGDEFDGNMPDASLAFNGALANGYCAFPDGLVQRHKDFIFIGAANTIGTGATMQYVGRMKQDAAFLDRFVKLEWPIDEALEDAITPNKQWLGRVRYVRRKLEQNPIKDVMITPRAAIYGSSLLAAGLSLEKTEKATIRQGMSDTQWRQVCPPWAWEEEKAA